MRSLFALALLMTVALPATARIGDNTRACEARYGRPVRVSDTGDLATYRRGRLSVVVHFTTGAADMVSYGKLPRAGSPESHQPAIPMTDEEVQSFLSDNTGGGVWVAGQPGERSQTWILGDGERFARWDAATDSLMIYTRAFAEAGSAGADG